MKSPAPAGVLDGREVDVVDKFLAMAAACSVVLFGPSVAAAECVSLVTPSTCLLEGKLFAKAVDDSRFLVAVDLVGESEQANGQVDHLFLFSRNTAPADLPAGVFEGSLWIDIKEGIADIRPRNGQPIPVVFKNRPTSHYWGFGDNARIDWLYNLQLAPQCDHYEGSCWVANGWNIGFPL